jgi:Hg(II)-responsive transcriptional regulator
MWISEAAQQAGVNVQTIRYYERRGLLPAPRRRSSGYRELPFDTVRRIRFIKRAQDLGFSLEEIGELLQLRSETGRNRKRIRAVAEQRLEQIDRKISELSAMQQALRTLVAHCHSGADLDCPIIEALEHAEAGS